MKKLGVLLFSLLLILLTACGAPQEEAAPKEPELSLAFERVSYSEDYESDDLLFATLRLSYPEFRVVTADGEEYLGAAGELDAVVKRMNEEIAGAIAEKKDRFADISKMAKEDYAQLDAEFREYWGHYALEVNYVSVISDAYVATVGTGYWNTGGAHPTSFLETWNFDCITGEFFILEDLAADTEACIAAVADEIMRQIYADGMDQWYYEDFESVVRDLAYTQISFADEGMTVTFLEYALGPHAVGLPSFKVPYSAFKEHLSEHGRNLLSIR